MVGCCAVVARQLPGPCCVAACRGSRVDAVSSPAFPCRSGCQCPPRFARHCRWPAHPFTSAYCCVVTVRIPKCKYICNDFSEGQTGSRRAQQGSCEGMLCMLGREAVLRAEGLLAPPSSPWCIPPAPSTHGAFHQHQAHLQSPVSLLTLGCACLERVKVQLLLCFSETLSS